jgi:hypothetical protein
MAEDTNEHLGSSDCSSGMNTVAWLRIMAALTSDDGKPHVVMMDAADMLEFLFDEMQMWSPKIDGSHRWSFRQGWPWTHCVGRNPEEAIKAAIREVREQTGKITK